MGTTVASERPNLDFSEVIMLRTPGADSRSSPSLLEVLQTRVARVTIPVLVGSLALALLGAGTLMAAPPTDPNCFPM